MTIIIISLASKPLGSDVFFILVVDVVFVVDAVVVTLGVPQNVLPVLPMYVNLSLLDVYDNWNFGTLGRL